MVVGTALGLARVLGKTRLPTPKRPRAGSQQRLAAVERLTKAVAESGWAEGCEGGDSIPDIPAEQNRPSQRHLHGKHGIRSSLANSPFTRRRIQPPLDGEDLPQADAVQDDGPPADVASPAALLGRGLRALGGRSEPHPASSPQAALPHADRDLIITAWLLLVLSPSLGYASVFVMFLSKQLLVMVMKSPGWTEG